MKIQLDTIGKTIKVEGTVSLKELVDTLEKLLPKGLWKEFNLESNTTIVNWNSPYIWPVIPSYPQPLWLTDKTNDPNKYYVTCEANNCLALNEGTFNISC